jgi:transcriptional pleiotropic regulator of transition state genes
MDTSGKIFSMKVGKVTSKGQITIPLEARRALGLDEGSYVEVRLEADELRLRKIIPVRPLAADDPIWRLVGAASSGSSDVSENHDRYLAAAEIEGWHESS